jgi:hypothetical protein
MTKAFLLPPLIVTVLFSSCATVPSPEEIALSSTAQQRFAQCLPSEGTMYFEINSTKKKVHLASHAEWLGEHAQDYQLQLIDPLGQTQLDFAYAGNKLKVSGTASRKLPPLSADDEGFLKVASHRIGIRVAELPCLFHLEFPQEWKERVVDYKRSETGETLRIRMDQREIRIIQQDATTVCAHLQWWRYWGLVTREMNWCYDLNKQEASMELPEGWKILWSLGKDDLEAFN